MPRPARLATVVGRGTAYRCLGGNRLDRDRPIALRDGQVVRLADVAVERLDGPAAEAIVQALDAMGSPPPDPEPPVGFVLIDGQVWAVVGNAILIGHDD